MELHECLTFEIDNSLFEKNCFNIMALFVVLLLINQKHVSFQAQLINRSEFMTLTQVFVKNDFHTLNLFQKWIFKWNQLLYRITFFTLLEQLKKDQPTSSSITGNLIQRKNTWLMKHQKSFTIGLQASWQWINKGLN